MFSKHFQWTLIVSIITSFIFCIYIARCESKILLSCGSASERLAVKETY